MTLPNNTKQLCVDEVLGKLERSNSLPQYSQAEIVIPPYKQDSLPNDLQYIEDTLGQFSLNDASTKEGISKLKVTKLL